MPLTIRQLLAVALSALCLPQLGNAAKDYTPDTRIDLEEPWRWSVLEELEIHEAYCAAYDKNGTAWFGNASGASSFDGTLHQRFPFPFKSGNSLFAKDIFCASDGSVYLLTTKRFAVLDPNRQWTLISEIDSGTTKGSIISESADGSIWLVLENHLHTWKGGRLVRLEGLPPIHESIVVDDRDRIWMREMDDSNLLVHPARMLAGNRLAPLIQTLSLDKRRLKSTSRLHKDKDGHIWALTIWAENFAQKFDLDFNRSHIPSPPPLGRRSNLSFVSVDEDTKILLRPPELLLYEDGVWKNFDVGEYSVPSNNPFLVRLPGDKILLGGNVEQTYLIDASFQRWKTYRNLSIQCEDADRNRWFLSKDNLAIHYHEKSNTWTAFDSTDGVINSPNKITISKDGTVWVSGRHNDAAAVSRLVNGKWIRDLFPEVGYTFSHLATIETSNGNIIFGNGSERPMPQGSTGGIIVYRKIDGSYLANHLTPPLYPERVATLIEQPSHGLWLGEAKLWRSQPSNGLGAEPENALSATWIDHLSLDQNQNLWVSKWGDGLYRFDGENWQLFRTRDGIASNQTVYALPSTRDSSVWLATRKGISRFDGKSWIRHTLPECFAFRREGGTLFESAAGELWLNQVPRLWFMNRNRPVAKHHRTFRTVRYQADQAPPETLIASSAPTLQEPANALFSWRGIDPWNDTPSKNLEYSYRLSPQDKWSPFQKETSVSILDLQSGDYSLEVRARDHNLNIDPTPATLAFEILPPTWKQPWFILSAFLISAAIISLIATLIRMRMKHLLELEKFKLDFFTNLSHELRTPLSVILGPLESMASKANATDEKHTLNMVLRNARKMLDLVNQLLEFRKVELGKLKYRPVQGEVVGFIKDSIFSLGPLWEKKQQSLKIESNLNAFRCGFDPDKLISIVDNIVANAIKYTPEQGKIHVSIEINTDSNRKSALDFQVRDNGIGIPKEKLPKVTDPFYRVDSRLSEQESSGIGLALVSGLVELWGGSTKIESETEGNSRGTCITVHLPLNLFKGSLPNPNAPAPATTLAPLEQEPEPISVSKPKILLVEDNPDVLEFLDAEISQHFETCKASNGMEGLDQIKSQRPDLVITDVMMPEMDGIEFCRTIREDQDNCHLPVIILTARTADEHYIEGIDTGADEYFSKPIRADLLIARIKNLLRSRQNLRDSFSEQVRIEPQNIAVVSSDRQLLEKAIKTVEANLQTEGYDVERFAKDLAMSRITLYRKLKAITGYSAVDFMRSIRLKRAAQLLQATDLTVGEILIQVGYYDASSFSRAFKKEFNLTPTQFRESKANQPRAAS